MSSKSYIQLADKESSDEGHTYERPKPQRTSSLAWIALLLILLPSLALNGLTLAKLQFLEKEETIIKESEFAKLSWDVPSIFNKSSVFNSPDREVEDAAWASELVDPELFLVALDSDYIEEHRLMDAARWPWDETKGVYLLNAGHQLHCIHLFRTTINELHSDSKPSWPREHLIHCAEFLLQNVMCYADDLPLYAPDHSGVTPGDNTPRVCRDWNKIQTWAKERSACYHDFTLEGVKAEQEHDKYKFCPDGSRPWEKSGL